VPGETAYIYITGEDTYFRFRGYTTEKEIHEEKNVTLNATVTWNETTKNITARWNEPRNVTTPWAAYTGSHIINVII
jgi:orotate phosphoribosyltransferase-like protein